MMLFWQPMLLKLLRFFSAGQKKSPVNFGAAVSGVVVLDCNTNTGLI